MSATGRMRFFSVIILLFVLAALSPRAFAQPADSLEAVVNDRPITQQQIERLIGPQEQMIYDRDRDHPEMMHREISKLWQNGSEELITREVILNEFKTAIKVPD